MTLHPDQEAKQQQRSRLFLNGPIGINPDSAEHFTKVPELKPCKSFESNGQYCDDCAEKRDIEPSNFPTLFLNYTHYASC